MTKRYYEMALQMFALVLLIMLGMFIWAVSANAASLKVCYKDLSVDTADINLYVNSTKTNSVFPGQTQVDGSICGTITPVPSIVGRGQTQTYTLRALNTLGEESVASNALTFRFPQVPTAPTFVSVGGLP